MPELPPPGRLVQLSMSKYKVYICGPGEIGPQCGYVSYLAGMEYGPKRVPMHVHRKPDGTWRETAWGPEKDCREKKVGDAS